MTVVQVSHFFVKDEQFPTKSYSSLQQYLVIDDVYSFNSHFAVESYAIYSSSIHISCI